MTTIILTENAANRIKALLVKENNPDYNLRLFVSGGGCSGFQYGFTFDEEQEEDDTIVTNNDVKLLVDSASIQYLDGTTVDFEETLQSSQFVIKNPNAVSKCGCGSSFSV